MQEILAGTGHRPIRLGLSYSKLDQNKLTKFVIQELIKLEKPTKIISGMAQGFDWALAEAAIELKIPFEAAVPFKGYESKWPSQNQKDFHALLEKAEKVSIVCEGNYEAWKLIKRDHYMIDNCTKVLSLFDGINNGGTAKTILYAKNLNRPIIALWSSWKTWNQIK